MSDKNTKVLHFTLGPVQGFVAQARRTRDLWAGSFLLSYLSGQAMLAVIEDGGEIAFPFVGASSAIVDPLLRAIIDSKDNRSVEKEPQIGSLPNRFKAIVPNDFDAHRCIENVKKAWMKIADKVWEKYIEPCNMPDHDMKQTRKIWHRQVQGFWDISWVIGKDNDLLNRRKNWRTYIPTEEAGSKCTIMGNYQELSGYERAYTPEQRCKQDNFWVNIREVVKKLDLRDDERLCAIAFIKRLFPHVAEECIGWGKDFPLNYPSTPAISALPWVAESIIHKPELCKKMLRLSPKEYPERDIIKSTLVKNALERNPDKELKNFASLDGKSFYIHFLKNERLWDDFEKKARNEMIETLKSWGFDPSPFYALLLMDGDSLGAILQLGDEAGEKVSKALAAFTYSVADIIEAESGFLIYAGGDDVLAMLPLDNALNAAIRLRQSYKQAFTKEYPEAFATISATIVYAHHSQPLKDIISSAHYLLDDVAKDKTGRDSLAVTIWRPSGQGFLWSAPWDHILDDDMTTDNKIERVIDDLRTKEDEQIINSSFIYNLRERYQLLNIDHNIDSDFGEEFYLRLFSAEYFKNTDRNISKEGSKKLMAKLYDLCRQVFRDKDRRIIVKNDWSIDGALYARFLVTRGVEK